MSATTGCGHQSGATAPVAAPQVAPGTVVSLDALTPFFVPGEAITWELSYHGIEGGRARLAVGEPGLVGDRQLVALRAEAETSGIAARIKLIRDYVSSWVDVTSGAPVRTESEALFGERHTVIATTWRGAEQLAELVVREQQGDERSKRRKLPSVRTHDPLSAILMLRRWDAPTGARAAFYTLGGQRLWRTELVVEARESIDCPIGTRAAIRIAGVSTRMTPAFADDLSKKPRTFTLWLSDDAQRIPLRVAAHTELGDVMIDATSYSAP